MTAFGGLVGVTQISQAQTGNTGTPPSTGANPGGGLDVLADNCDESGLPAHTGFQEGDRCVSTAFGEVGAAAKNPTLLIVEAPRTVREGEPFRLEVSTRNLVRDRFLPAAQGGYYVESSLLDEDRLVRGHFHTACRILSSTVEAPDPSPVPAFFVATEDGGGGAEPDVVTIEVPGLPAGIAQCGSWAGDGSHRVPMMQRANQTPAIDAVRIEVRPDEERPPAEQSDQEQPLQEGPPAEQSDQEGRPGEVQPSVDPVAGGPAPDQPADSLTAEVDPATGETAPVEDLPPVDAVADDSDGALAFTGVNTLVIVLAGAGLLVAGVAITFLTRRRRPRYPARY